MDRVYSVTVRIASAEAAKDFVGIVSAFPVEMDLRSGRYVVDAKSILGILSLDSTQDMRLDVYADDITEIKTALKDYVIE